MAIDYKVYRTIIIITLILNILALFGIISMFGYNLDTKIISSIQLKHIIAIINIYILYIIWRRF